MDSTKSYPFPVKILFPDDDGVYALRLRDPAGIDRRLVSQGLIEVILSAA